MPFRRIDVLHYHRCNILLDGFLFKCMTVSAAAMRCSMQSEKLCAHDMCCLLEKHGVNEMVTRKEREDLVKQECF